MASVKSLKKWFWWHRWTSLICTLFLLIICITGLPLVFSSEIETWLNPTHFEEVRKNTSPANLDSLVKFSKIRYPSHLITNVYIDDDEPRVFVSMAPSWNPYDKQAHSLEFDQRTGKLLDDEAAASKQPKLSFIDFMLTLHRNLFLDLPGELFMGLMGLLFAISIISGIVLYGPFMKKLDFGTIRSERSKRLKWLDLHNLLGIATALWLFVVGITGVMNELSTPLFGIWQMTDGKAVITKYKDQSIPKQHELTSLQGVLKTAQKAMPDKVIGTLTYPGSPYGSPYHFLVWTKGKEVFSSKIYTLALIDGRSGKLATILPTPFYLWALEISRPLHFGDYGGLPLKILWFVFDLIAIIVLVSGIYLWFVRRKFYTDYFLKLSNDAQNNHERKL